VIFPRPSFPEPRIRYVYSVALFNVLLLVLLFVLFLPRWVGTSGFALQLPQVISAEPVSVRGYTIVILEDDSVYLRGRKLSLEELRGLVMTESKKEATALIKADRQARVGVLASVWDVFRAAGISRIYLATNE
jgi:biopolymer transport protein ExbD